MRFRLNRSLLLNVLFLIILAAGIVSAEDGETYGAYPGSPTSAPLGAYPGGPTTVPSYPQTPTALSGPSPVTPVQLGGQGTSAVTAIYSTQAPPANLQNVLLSYDIKASPPTAVYFSGTYMPWASFYQIFPAKEPAFWVSSYGGWSWYATCPVGGWIQNLMYVPYTGTLKLYEFYPDGTVKLYSYGIATPGYKYIWFYADTPGRHLSLITVFDKPSNYITIDVV